MQLTIKIKLLTNDQQRDELLKTMERFNAACNYVSEVAFQKQMFKAYDLHKPCYRYLRDEFELPSQLAVRAVGKVCESYKIQQKTQITFRPRSAVVYDTRLYSIKRMDTLSILTLNGRIKVPIAIGEYAKVQHRRMRGQADLIYVDGIFYLCVVVDEPDNAPIEVSNWLGVDMGIVNLATTSDGKQFSGSVVDAVRSRISQHRSRLQRCGTKSAKRRLKAVSRKQSRFVRNINHCISKTIVNTAKALGLGVAIEDLKRIKKTVRKAERQRFGQWSFYQLGQFLEYKATLAGNPLKRVNPAYTSQTCSGCGHCEKQNRKSQSKFVCEACGLSLNADINAAINIARRALEMARAAVNPPIAESVVCRSCSHLQAATSLA
jgi:IS605 OrfB family transposase